MYLLALALCAPLAALPQEPARVAPSKRPRIGLVLAGGGARGAAHIGVLRVLEEQHVPVDLIAGTSMGAIVGGLYSAGLSPDEIEAVLSQTDWLTLFDDDPPRQQMYWRRKLDDRGFLFDLELGASSEGIEFPSGLIQGQKISPLFRSLTLRGLSNEDFDKLRLPYRAVAMDVVNGDTVVLAKGDLAMAMRASMSIAGAFAPVEIDGRLLVDGGYVNNMPVDVAQAMGADIVIAVDVGTPPSHERSKLRSFLSISSQVQDLVVAGSREAARKRLDEDDVLVVPELGDITFVSFDQATKAVQIGYAAAQEHLQEFEALRVDDATWKAFLERQRAPAFEPPRVLSIAIDNQSRIATDRLEAQLSVRVGDKLDSEAVRLDLERLSGMGYFESVDFRIAHRDGGVELTYVVREKQWGPNYLRFGLALQEDFDGRSSYELGFGLIVAPINRWGAEWRTEFHVGNRFGAATEFYQPLGADMRWFVAPHAAIVRRTLELDEGAGPDVQYTVDTNGVGLDFGRLLGTWGETRVGIERWKGEIDARTDLPKPDEGHYTDAGYTAALRWDTLDDRDFPSSGIVGGLSAYLVREDLGADANSERAQLNFAGYRSFKRVTGTLGLEVGSSFGSDLPLQQEFLLGGFGRLTGLAPNSIAGDDLGLLRAGGYTELGGSMVESYLGLSFEVGNVWDVSEDPSDDDLEVSAAIFFGADTPLGPFILGWGAADEGRNTAFMVLGRRF